MQVCVARCGEKDFSDQRRQDMKFRAFLTAFRSSSAPSPPPLRCVPGGPESGSGETADVQIADFGADSVGLVEVLNREFDGIRCGEDGGGVSTLRTEEGSSLLYCKDWHIVQERPEYEVGIIKGKDKCWQGVVS